MSDASKDNWARTVARAGESLEPLVRPALESLAQARWGDPTAGHWRVLSTTDRATWELAQLVRIDSDGNYHYAHIQVMATVDPDGQLVTWQVNNGAEFLGLTDLTAYGLQRGVVYLLDQEYRERISAEPLFTEEAPRTASAARGLWQRLRKLARRH